MAFQTSNTVLLFHYQGVFVINFTFSPIIIVFSPLFPSSIFISHFSCLSDFSSSASSTFNCYMTAHFKWLFLRRAVQQIPSHTGAKMINSQQIYDTGGSSSQTRAISSTIRTADSPYRHMKIMSPNQNYEWIGVHVLKCCYNDIFSGMVGVEIRMRTHWILQSAPFSHFLDALALVIDSYLLDDIYGRCQVNEKFVIGGHVLTWIDEDFDRILSPSFTNNHVLLNETKYKNDVYKALFARKA